MRIVCDSCSAKYSIADEKIAGKLFKVRCKKCNTMIMVDGTVVPGSEPAAPVDAGNDASWYVVIDGAQQGPLSHTEVVAQLGSGAVDGGTFAWREGMGDWLPLSDITEFASHAGGSFDGEGDAFEDEATRVVSSKEAFSSGGLLGGDAPRLDSGLVEPISSPSGSGLLAKASNASGADFFASARAAATAPAADPAPAASFSAPAPAAAPAAAPAPADDGMTGERNESSVLFSLSDLTSKKKKTTDDVPRTEGSGLIDIRVLASAASAEPAGRAAASGPAPSMAVAPMVALPPRRSNKGLIALIALGSVLIIGLGVALVMLMLQKPEVPAPIVVAPTADPAAPVAAVPTDGSGAPTEVAAVDPAAALATADAGAAAVPPVDGSGAGDGSGAAAAAAAEAEAAGDTGEEAEAAVAAAEPTQEEREEERSRDEERAAEREEEQRVSAATQREERSEPSREERAPTPSRGDSQERSPEAVNRALEALRRGGEEEEEEEAEPTPAAAPTSLSRDQVRSTVRRYGSRISRCRTPESEGQRYPIRFVVQPSGSVTNVQASESDDASRCLVGVVRDMSFPSFQGAAVPVTYPFNL